MKIAYSHLKVISYKFNMSSPSDFQFFFCVCNKHCTVILELRVSLLVEKACFCHIMDHKGRCGIIEKWQYGSKGANTLFGDSSVHKKGFLTFH